MRRFPPLHCWCVAAFLLISTTTARAQIYTWDPAVDQSGSGGTGTWDGTAANWLLTGTNVVWPNTTSAIAAFGGIGGTVTLGSPITAGGLTFNVGGYIIDNGGNAANTLTLGTTPATSTITVTNLGDTATISAILTGVGSTLTMAGNGTLVLSGINTYTGATRLNGGFLSISDDFNLGTAPGAATAGHLTFNGGTLTITGTSLTTLASTRGIALTGAGTINIANAALTTTYGGIMAGTGLFTKAGPGTLALTGTQTASGGTSIDGGTIAITATGNLPTGSVTFNGGTLLSSSTAQITMNRTYIINAGGGTLDQNVLQKHIFTALSGSGVWTRNASANAVTRGLGITTVNDVQITGTSTFTGSIVINGGQLEVGQAALGTPTMITINGGEISANGSIISSPLTINGGSISTVNANQGFSGPITVNSAFTIGLGDFFQAVNRNMTISGNLSGTGVFTFLNAATSVAAEGAGQTLTLSGNNSAYTSLITATPGYNVLFGAANSYSTGGTAVTSSATALGGVGVSYDFGATPPTINASGPNGIVLVNTTLASTTTLDMSTFGGGQLYLGSSTTGTYAGTSLTPNSDNIYRLGGGGGTLTISSAVLNGTNSVIVNDTRINGSGTTVLSGLNSFDGAVTVNTGTLSVNTIAAVNGGPSSLGNPTTIANGTINLGSGTANGTLLYTGSASTNDRVINLAGTTGGGTITNSGNGLLTFTSAPTFTGTGAKTLTLQGSTAANTVFSGTIAGGSIIDPSPLTIAKAGTNFLMLSGTGNTATSLTLAGGVVDIGANGLTLNNTGGSVVQTSANTVLNGTGGGVLTLSAVNTTADGGNFGAASGVTLTVNTPIAISLPNGILEVFGGTASTGVVVLNAISSFPGNVSNASGTLSVSTIGASGANGNLGAGSLIRLGNAANAGIVLRYTGTGETTNRVIDLSATTGTVTIDQFGTGALRFTSAFTATGAGNKVLALGGSTTGTGEIAAAIVNSSGTTGVTKIGTGTWALTAANTYTGTTTAGGGVLQLDFSAATAPATNIVSATSVLSFSGGGTLNLIKSGTSATSNSQTFASTTLAAGGGRIVMNSNGGTGGLLLQLGAITRSNFSTLDITLPANAASATNGVTTTTANNATAGILGGYATVNGVDWAVSGASATVPISAYTAYTTLTAAGGGTAATTNFRLTSAANTTTTLTAAITANSLKIVDTGTSTTAALANGGFAITFSGAAAGGLLFTPTTAGNVFTISGTGVVGGGTTNQFLVNVATGGSLTISAPMVSTTAAAGSLLKTGRGLLTVTNATSAYTGDIYLNGGTLAAGNYAGTAASILGGQLGTTYRQIFFNGGTFQSTANTNNNTPSATNVGFVFNFGGGGGTLNVNSGVTLTIDDGSGSGVASTNSQLQGAGDLFKTGVGTLSLGAGTSNFSVYTGKIFVNAGTVTNGTGTNNFGDTTSPTTVASGAVVNLNGNNTAEPFILSGMGLASAPAGVLIATTGTSTATGPILLAANSSLGGAGNMNLTGGVSGAFALTKVGAGIITLSGFNGYTGGTTITAGTLVFSTIASVPTAGVQPIPIATGGTLGLNNFSPAEVLTILARVPTTATGAFAFNSTAAAVNLDFTTYPGLSLGALGPVTYSGTLTFPATGGTARFGGGGGTLTLNQNIPATNATLVIAGVGGGTTILNGTNSVTSVAVANGNTLSISSDANIGGAVTPISFLGSTITGGAASTGLQITGTTLNNLTSHPVTFTSPQAFSLDITAAGNTFTFDKNATIAGAFTKLGAGTAVLSGTNTFTSTTISAGTLRLGSAGALTQNVPFTISGTSVFDLNGRNHAVTVYTDSATTSIVDTAAGPGTDTFTQVNAANTTFNALINNGSNGRNVAIAIGNTNNGTVFANAGNTFAGGLTLLNNATGTRLTVSNLITTVGTPGAIISSNFGTGPITIGQAVTDRAGIYFTLANNTIANAIVFNTALGTDRAGLRSDVAGITLSGTITANLASAAFSTNTAVGSFALTGQVTGAQGLIVNGQFGTGLTVTLNNVTANPNNYQGTTVIGANAAALAGTFTLALGAANQIPNGTTGNVVLNSSATVIPRLFLNGFNETINGLASTGAAGTANGIVDGVSGTPTLTLGDGNANATFAGKIQNTAGTLSLTKIGTGVQQLTGANTYVGLTTVSAGQLAVTATGTLAAASSLSVASGAVFAYLPTNPANLTQAAITLHSATLNLNYSTTAVSSITSTAAATATGSVRIGLSGDSITSGTYTLLAAPSGLTAGGASYTVMNPVNFTFTTTVSDSLVQINATSQSALAAAFWIGGLAGDPTVWAASDGALTSNWTTDGLGTATPLVPGANATVTFSDAAATSIIHLGMTLGANMSVAGVTFDSVNPLSTLHDGNVLTVGASGITMTPTSNTVTLGNSFILGVTQSWTNDHTTNAMTVSGSLNTNGVILSLAGAGNFAVSGVITGTGGLTKTGTGTATLSGANNYTGATAINTGSVVMSGAGRLGSGSALTLGGGALDLGGTTQTVGAVSITAPAASGDTIFNGSLAGSSYSATNTAGNVIISSVLLANGTAGFTKNGAGTVTLTATNTFTGAVSLTGGTTVMANTQALGTTTANITLNGTTLVVATAGGDTPYNFTLGSNLSASIVSDVASGSVGINHTLGNFSVGGSAAVGGTQINVLAGAGITSGSPSITVGLLNMTSGAASAVITTVNPTTANLIIGNVSNNSATAANTRTLNLDGTSQGNRITGTIAEGSVAPTIITKSNTSTWTLSGASTYIGATTVTAGTLTFDATSTYNPANGIAGLMTINGATAVVNLAGAYNTSNGNGNAIFQIQGGGTLNFTGTSNLSLTTAGAGIRIGEASAGTFNMTAGTFNYTVITGSNLVVGRTSGGNGTLNISGGTFTFNGAGTGGFILSNDANTTSTVNLSNTGSLIVNGSVFRIGGTATSTATINLDGGTFTLAVSPTAAGTSVFNFNGGLFKSNAALAVGSLTRANVRNGGANFDTFGGTITMNQALEHSNVLGDNAIDGGLTKTGTGSLTLTDVNTYTGNTTVSNGSLTLSGSGSIATSSTVILAAAGTLSTAAVTGGTNFDATSNQFALASGQTLKGTGTVSGPITVRAASILAPGASPGALTLTTGLTTQANGTFAIGVYDGTTPALPTTGLSSVNANSNNFLTITGGTTVIDAGTLIAIDAGATTFTDGVAYSYLVASGAGVGDQSTLSITNPSQFTFASSLGYTASGFSLTGDNGNIYLNFTPVVPEPALIGFITLAGLGLSSVIRRRPSTTV